MSKDKRENPEVVSSTIQTELPEKAEAGKLYTPKKRETRPAKLTARQYVKDANLDAGIGALVLSMYGEKIMPCAEWERTVATLLKRQVK